MSREDLRLLVALMTLCQLAEPGAANQTAGRAALVAYLGQLRTDERTRIGHHLGRREWVFDWGLRPAALKLRLSDAIGRRGAA
jgi:hypothetical protein